MWNHGLECIGLFLESQRLRGRTTGSGSSVARSLRQKEFLKAQVLLQKPLHRPLPEAPRAASQRNSSIERKNARVEHAPQDSTLCPARLKPT